MHSTNPAVAHPDGSVDPVRDVERLDLEFTLADLGVIEKRIERLRTQGHHGTPAEREQNDRELAVLEKLAPPLREGVPIRDIELTEDDQKRIRGFRFLTEKPVLVLLNIGEDEVARAAQISSDFAAKYVHQHSGVEALSARIEMEIGQLDEEEASAFQIRPWPNGVQPGEGDSRQLQAARPDLVLYRRSGRDAGVDHSRGINRS